jgi:hypothetical protein
MNINKAIRKQNKSYKRFLLFNCFIFLSLPLVLYFSKQITAFYISYLSLIEVLILLAIMVSINTYNLKFQYDGVKLKISYGIAGRINILCDKVVFVHVERNDDIILITTSRVRNEKLNEVSLKFLQSHSYVSYYYNRIKNQAPEEDYYYLIIKSGGLFRYQLLDTIYKSCVYAVFSEEAVKKIKKYREMK